MYYHVHPCTEPEYKHHGHPHIDDRRHPAPHVKPEEKECEPLTNVEINDIIEKVYIDEV